MNKFFTLETENPIDRVKFNVTRNMFTFLTIVLSALAAVNFIQNDINKYALACGAGISILVLLLLLILKKYKIAAAVAMIFGTCMTFFNMMVTSNFGHFVDFFSLVIGSLLDDLD